MQLHAGLAYHLTTIIAREKLGAQESAQTYCLQQAADDTSATLQHERCLGHC